MSAGILHSEPRYKVDEVVHEIMGRRDSAIQEMEPELRKLIIGLVDQFSMLKKQHSQVNLRTLKFARVRWINDCGKGVLVLDVEHNGRPLTPQDVRYW